MTLDDLVASDMGEEREREGRRARHAVARLEAFSDGVFAIAATLLVLDLTVGELGPVATDSDLWNGLVSLGPDLLAFVVSFLLLCLLWWLHTRAFDDVVRVDRPFVALNSLRLLGVVLIPFTTSISSSHPDLTTGAVYFALDYFAVVAIGAAQHWYATSPRRDLVADITDAEKRATRQASLSAVILAFIALLLSPIAGTLAFLVFALDPFLTRRLGGSTSVSGAAG